MSQALEKEIMIISNEQVQNYIELVGNIRLDYNKRRIIFHKLIENYGLIQERNAIIEDISSFCYDMYLKYITPDLVDYITDDVRMLAFKTIYFCPNDISKSFPDSSILINWSKYYYGYLYLEKAIPDTNLHCIKYYTGGDFLGELLPVISSEDHSNLVYLLESYVNICAKIFEFDNQFRDENKHYYLSKYYTVRSILEEHPEWLPAVMEAVTIPIVFREKELSLEQQLFLLKTKLNLGE